MSTNKLPLIYIAGPFRGPSPIIVRRHVEAARDLGLRVAEAGGYPVIPHTMTADFDKLLTDQFWLDGTLEMLKRCDAMVLTYDWEKSSGARAEQAWAHQYNMPWYVDVDPTQAHIMGRGWPLHQFVEEVTRNLIASSWFERGYRGEAPPPAHV
jgi:hypothetical protein